MEQDTRNSRRIRLPAAELRCLPWVAVGEEAEPAVQRVAVQRAAVQQVAVRRAAVRRAAVLRAVVQRAAVLEPLRLPHLIIRLMLAYIPVIRCPEAR